MHCSLWRGRRVPPYSWRLVILFFAIVEIRRLAMGEKLKWYDEDDSSPWIDALAELRQQATREGYCYPHVQAITVAIDQYAE